MDEARVEKLTKQSPVLWAYRYVPNEKGERLDFRDHKFQIDILNDFAPEIAIKKGSQVGMTTITTTKCLYLMDNYPVTIIYCADEKTELLSKRGWLKYNQLREDDEILTLQKDLTSRWSPIEEIFKKKVKMKMKKIGTSRFSSLTTPNHRWLVTEKDGKGEAHFVESKDLFAYHRTIPIAAEFAGKRKSIYSDDFVELVGWVITEGHYKPNSGKHGGYTIDISQSLKVNPDKCERIENLLNRLGLKYSKYGPYESVGNDCIGFAFAGEEADLIRKLFPDKKLSAKFVASLTSSQASLLVETMIDGDGWRGSTKTCVGFTQKSKKTADNFAMAAVIAGHSVSIRRRNHAKDKNYTVLLMKNKQVYVDQMKYEDVDYEGIVWCPRTRDGTFLARREGTVYWTGNTFPTATDVSKFSAARFNPIVRRSPYLSERLNGLDNVSIKSIGDSHIYFGGTFTEKQAISVPADIIIHDELDFSKPDVRDSYSSRLSHSKWAFTWVFSTPTLPEFGIDAEYERSDQRNWIVKCEFCNEHQIVTYQNNIVVKKSKKNGRKRRYWGCIKCGKELDRTKGEWVPKYRNRRVHGYYICPTICSWIDPLRLIRLQKKSSPKVFNNFHLGLAYAGGSEMLTREVLLKATLNASLPKSGEGYYMGVDQGDTLHVEVSREIEGKRQIVWYGIVNSFHELDRFMHLYGIRCCVIDALPNHHSAKEFRDRFPGRVYLAHYGNIKVKDEQEYESDKHEYTLFLDRTDMLDTVGNSWISGGSYVLAPDNEHIKNTTYDDPRYKTGWIQQMCNMKRDIEELDTGEHKVKWVKTGPDHYRHADLYNYVAFRRYASADKGDILVGGTSPFTLSQNPSQLEVYVPTEEDGYSDDEEAVLVGASNGINKDYRYLFNGETQW